MINVFKSKYCIVITSFNSKQEATVMAKKLITSKLAACVQIAEVESIYQWQGECCQEKEFRLEIKSKMKFYKEIEAFILKEHSYETPEIVLLPIEKASSGYALWMETLLEKRL